VRIKTPPQHLSGKLRLRTTEPGAKETSESWTDGGMNIHKSKGCCRDEVKIIKMETDQKAASHIVFELPALDDLVYLPSQFITASFINVKETRHYQNHSPPLLTEQDTYLQNCVFRI
jgi:hypothetical protein